MITADLFANLKIPQYVLEIDEFPCTSPATRYIVRKALYGLRQVGREYKELDSRMDV